MAIFIVLAKIGTILLIVGVGYLYFLSAIAIFAREKDYRFTGNYDFLLLVPAHDEGRGLISTIQSLKKVKKTGVLKIVVIADNCDDDTAQVARDQGVETIERKDPSHMGKGYALEWAMNRFNLDDYNAVIIIDADTIVEENMLEVMAGSLSGDAGAIQLNYITPAREGKPLAYLQYIANLTENYLFYRPRNALHLPVLLRGTGMAIRTEILKKHPWDSHSITEDVDYAVNLLRDGYKIGFSTLSTVYARSPESFSQSFTQKTRWFSGTISLIIDNFWSLIKTGIATKNFRLVELAFSLFLLSRPSLIYISALMIVFSVLGPRPIQSELILVNVILICLLVIYILLGTFFSENKKRVLSAIPLMPLYGIWYLFVQLKSLFDFRRSKWTRTERKSDE